MEMDDDPEDWKTFNNKIREYVVFLLLFIILYFSSYAVIIIFKARRNGLFCSSYEDAVVHRISLWICTFSLGISIGAVLLLPMSIISYEILTSYPNSYYVQWLNSSLIQGMWNLIFLFSNLALFILLPFAHIMLESEGLPGSSKGVRSRAYEAGIVLILLGIMLLGITYIISALFDEGHYSLTSVFNVSNYYLPFLYSCVSFLGVLMLLICTPVGFARMFTGMGQFLMKLKIYHERAIFPEGGPGSPDIVAFCENQERLRRDWRYSWTAAYPVFMVMVMILTVMSVALVSHNSLELCMGLKALPFSSKNLDLSEDLSSKRVIIFLAPIVEIVLILYLWCVSILGLYSLPLFCYLKPKLRNTSMSQIIGNCGILLVLSSALPVFARSLGITSFDLLGDFGRINWLGNFNIVLFHNIVFAVTTVVCLGTKITSAVRNELYYRILYIFHPIDLKTK